jgi:hypothetical protein
MHGWFDSMWHGWWWGIALLVLAALTPLVMRRLKSRKRGGL